MALGITILFFIAGVAGAFLPLVPAAPLVWMGVVVYGFFTQWQDYGSLFLLGQGILAIFASLLDWIMATKEVGRTKKTARWAVFLGMLLGPFILGPLGFIFGPLLAVFFLELFSGSSMQMATYMSWRTFIGLLKGAFARFVILLVMITWFFWTI